MNSRFSKSLWTVALLCAFAGLPSRGEWTEAAATGEGAPRIAFLSDRDGGGLFVMDTPGGKPRQIFKGAMCLAPAWSPDGKRIAFLGLAEADEALLEKAPQFHFLAYVVGVDGGSVTRLTKTPVGAGTLEWSPDGGKIAFLSSHGVEGSFGALYTVETSGKGEARLTDPNRILDGQKWSPDGSRLLYLAKESPVYTVPFDVFTIRADGQGTSRVTTEAHGAFGPLWSPDGGKIAYAAGKDEDVLPMPTQIVVIDADGKNRRVVAEVPGKPVGWTPDGKRLVTLYRKLGIVDLKSGKSEPLAGEYEVTVSSDAVSSLSPRGDRVLFESKAGGNPEIYSVDIASGKVENLTNSPSRDWMPVWGPIEKRK